MLGGRERRGCRCGEKERHRAQAREESSVHRSRLAAVASRVTIVSWLKKLSYSLPIWLHLLRLERSGSMEPVDMDGMIDALIDREGGYVADAADRGGPTCFGI